MDQVNGCLQSAGNFARRASASGPAAVRWGGKDARGNICASNVAQIGCHARRSILLSQPTFR